MMQRGGGEIETFLSGSVRGLRLLYSAGDEGRARFLRCDNAVGCPGSIRSDPLEAGNLLARPPNRNSEAGEMDQRASQ